jgi:hypothetical protein
MSYATTGPAPICPECGEPIGAGAMDSHLRWHAQERGQCANLGTFGGSDLPLRRGPTLQEDPRAHELEAEIRQLNDRIRAAELEGVVAAERARIRRELLDVVDGEYSDLFTGTGYEADIVAAVRLTDLRRVINRILPEEAP